MFYKSTKANVQIDNNAQMLQKYDSLSKTEKKVLQHNKCKSFCGMIPELGVCRVDKTVV